MRNESGSSSGLLSNVRLKLSGRSPSPHLSIRRSPSRTKIFPENTPTASPPTSPGSGHGVDFFFHEFPRSNTAYSTASEVRREQNLRAKFSEIIAGRHSTVQTWVKRRKMNFDLRRWSHTMNSNTDTGISRISSPVSLVEAWSQDQQSPAVPGIATTTEMTARQFALMTRMKILFLSDKEEEQKPLVKSTIMDPNFFSSPASSDPIPPVAIYVDAASLSSETTTSAETLSASILTSPSKVTVSDISSEEHQTGVTPLNDTPLANSISSMVPTSINTQFVKIGRFFVSDL